MTVNLVPPWRNDECFVLEEMTGIRDRMRRGAVGVDTLAAAP
jgi:hypothetical protein